MRALNTARKPGQRRSGDTPNTQLIKAVAHAQNVHQGVNGPHFMKMHQISRYLVRIRLSLGQRVKNRQGAGAHSARHVHSVENRCNIRRMPQRLFILPPPNISVAEPQTLFLAGFLCLLLLSRRRFS